MKKIFRYTLPALIACPMLLAACSEWTDPESVTLHHPSIEEQNPELYAQYLKALNEFKAHEHPVVIASVNNLGTAPANQSQHLTTLPDSIDYICLNNISDVNEMHLREMDEVRKKGTKVLGLIDLDAIENAWKAILDKEAANAAQATSSNEGNTEKGEEVGREDPAVVNAQRFIEYCKTETSKKLDAVQTIGVDGIIINYTGFDINSLVEDEQIAAETARQGACFNAIAQWKKTNENKLLFFKGAPQNLISKDLLSHCKYIIVNAHAAKNLNEMSYLILMALTKGVPTDRFIMGVTTPYLTNSGSYNGELRDGTSAITGAARWALLKTPDYTKAGILIDSAEADYFNVSQIFPAIREAISILSPNR